MILIEQAKTNERNHKLKRSQSVKRAVQPNGEGQISKKQKYNAKEKIRRMNLNATYLALEALPPDLRRTKFYGWSYPHGEATTEMDGKGGSDRDGRRREVAILDNEGADPK
ncbi:hypothetical protein Q3G72_000844 [Acer saccharum]|nr:hypothetical protein Q3G72_000844 [Acer saccharum]